MTLVLILVTFCCSFLHWPSSYFHNNKILFTNTSFTSLLFLFSYSSYSLSVSFFLADYYVNGSNRLIMTLVYDIFFIFVVLVLALVSFRFRSFIGHCRYDTIETVTVETPPEVIAVIRVGWHPVIMNHCARGGGFFFCLFDLFSPLVFDFFQLCSEEDRILEHKLGISAI